MQLKRTLTLLLALVLLLTGVLPAFAQAGPDLVADYMANLPEGWGVIRADGLATESLETDLYIIDVREVAEGEELGYIPETDVNIPLRELVSTPEMLPAALDAPIVVYCAGGHRSTIGMTVLQMLGYTNVRSLIGGFGGWAGADFEVVAETLETEAGEAPALDEAVLADLDNYLQNVLPEGWGIIRVDDLALEMAEDAPFLLDVREVAEYEQGYIEGAVNIPMRSIGENLDMLPVDQPIVIYCKSGFRAAIAMTALQVLGYDVRSLAGAINAWEAAGYEIVGVPEEAEAASADLDMTSIVADYMANLPAGWGVIRPDDLFTEMLEEQPMYLVDVREINEGEEQGYILNTAVNIPLRQLAASLTLLPDDLDTPIVVYCAAGTRSTIGMTVLQMAGYTNVRSLYGGFRGWTGAEYEVVEAIENEVMASEGPPVDEAMVTVLDDYLQNVLPEGWGVIRADDLALELVENPPFLVDVREPGELEELGYIEGALNAPMRSLGDYFDEIPMDQPVVVYCHSGFRGTIATVALQMLGYDARNLAGGITGWLSAGYEVEGGMESAEAIEPTLPEGEALDAEALAPVVAEFLAGVPQVEPGYASLRVDQFLELAEAPILIDVRQPGELEEQGHIEGAINVPLRDVAKFLDVYPADQQFVVYCAAGYRGQIATMALRMLGYDALNLRGGFRAWVAAEQPVVAGMSAEPMRAEFPAVDADLWTTVDAFMSNLPDGWGTIGAADLNAQLLEGEAPVLVDVRTAGEYAGGFIEGAINVPLDQMGAMMEMLPEDMAAPIVVYGSSGVRGAMAMAAARMLGYENVLAFAAGSDGWVGAGFELVTE